MAQTLGDLPVGAKVKAIDSKFYGKDLIFRVLGAGHSQDPADSVILQTNDIITARCFDAREPNNPNSIRQSYGNNRYLYSNLLQWLNSDAGANAWYTAKHSADQAPDSANIWQFSGTAVNPYNTQAGFMNGFTADFKNSLLTVTKRTVKDTPDGGRYEDVQSKFFLLSTTEVGLANENNIAEGSLYSLFSDSSKRVMVPTTECANNSTDHTINSAGSTITAGAAWHWWLRTPYFGNPHSVRRVNADGTLNSGIAYNGSGGVAPACAISKNQKVSDTVDKDGCYTLIYDLKIDKPTMSTTSYQATGLSITPVLEGYDASTMTLSGDTSATAVGEYILSVSPNSGYRWNDGTTNTLNFNWSIIAQKIDKPTMSTTSYKATKSEITPELNGYDSSTMTLSGDTSATNIGFYTLSVTPKDGYTWSDDSSVDPVDFAWDIYDVGVIKRNNIVYGDTSELENRINELENKIKDLYSALNMS